MGNFYVNYTVRGSSPTTVAAILAGRSAVVTSAQPNTIVVFDKESDEQSEDVIANLACRLSHDLSCPVLAVLNHDDDILWYRLYAKGEVLDDYNSTPGYFEPSAEPSAPSGGDAKKLCETFGASSVAEVEDILRKSSFDEGGYPFAVNRHSDLVAALGLPDFAVGYGYANLSNGELPDGLTEDDIIKVS